MNNVSDFPVRKPFNSVHWSPHRTGSYLCFVLLPWKAAARRLWMWPPWPENYGNWVRNWRSWNVWENFDLLGLDWFVYYIYIINYNYIHIHIFGFTFEQQMKGISNIVSCINILYVHIYILIHLYTFTYHIWSITIIDYHTTCIMDYHGITPDGYGSEAQPCRRSLLRTPWIATGGGVLFRRLTQQGRFCRFS